MLKEYTVHFHFATICDNIGYVAAHNTEELHKTLEPMNYEIVSVRKAE